MALVQISRVHSYEASTLEVCVTGDNQADTITQFIDVPPGAVSLAITATNGASSLGSVRGLSGPHDANVRIFDPQGQNQTHQIRETGHGKAVTIHNPMRGEWQIEIVASANASVEVCASAVTRHWLDNLARGAKWFSCKACKVGVKALVLAAIINAGQFIAIGLVGAALVAQVMAVAGGLINALVAALHLTPQGLELLFDLLASLTDSPIDEILTRVCAFVNLC